MGHITKRCIEKINAVDIRDIIPGCKKKPSQEIECPFCGAKKFSVVHKKGKNFAHCFACEKTMGVIDAAMHFNNLDFVRAAQLVAQEGNIIIQYEEDERRAAVTAAKDQIRQSFCEKQLAASGLTVEDIRATVHDEQGYEISAIPMRKGGIGPGFTVDEYGNDMLIYYYDLYGRPIKYQRKGTQRYAQYVRVRWSNPAYHKDESGKPQKYMTPEGAPSVAYIPQYIRSKFKAAEHIETLFVQEGEKKAEKACKHGIPSIGIQGIGNFGKKKDGLLPEIQRLAEVCTIRNIVLMMDSDWDDLSSSVTVGEKVNGRPWSFSEVVIKFKDQCMSLHIAGLNVDVWWGHVNHNPKGDKGIDDILANSLKGEEDTLRASIDEAMNAHDGKSKWADVHKISVLSDYKIKDFWALNNDEDFYVRHKDKLDELKSFRIGHIAYVVEDGQLKKTSMSSGDADIWSIDRKKPEDPKVVFNIRECLQMLNNCGFCQLRSEESKSRGAYDWIQISNGIIEYTNPKEIRWFVQAYIDQTTKQRLVKEFFDRKLPTILSDKQLEMLRVRDNDFIHYFPDIQKINYNNGAVHITSADIVPGQPLVNVWRRQIIDRKFKRVRIIEDIQQVDGEWVITPTDDAAKCEMLKFLINTSNMAYRHDNRREPSEKEEREFRQHLVNKLTTIGYLLTDYKFANERRAIIAQDYQISEVGQAQGGTGKSIFGLAIGHIVNQTVIDGKSDMGDKFAYETVTLETRNIFIDDIKLNFDFERLYPMVTGKMQILRKSMQPLLIEADKSPKIILTTNNAINNADSDSTARRISYIEFSSWYGRDYTPYNEFKHQMFEDWDDEQWTLFDNLMCECVMFYLRSRERNWIGNDTGIIQPPMENITRRTQRQFMGEIFYQWALEYFAPNGPNINVKKKKSDVVNDFFKLNDKFITGVTPAKFTKKLQAFVAYEGLDFNISEPNEQGLFCAEFKKINKGESFIGRRDSRNGCEWYLVSNQQYKEIGLP